MASKLWTELEAKRILQETGLADRGWYFVWDNARERGGQCRFRLKQISMSRYLVPMWSDDEVVNTLWHEAAHALVGPGAGHGPVWRAKMRELGRDPLRCHDNQTVPGRYVAMCDTCGGEAYRAHRFTAAMRQGRHHHKTCGQRVRWVDTATVSV
jgi:SprT protein